MAISKSVSIYLLVFYVIYQINTASCQSDTQMPFQLNSTSTTNVISTVTATYRTYRPLITKPTKQTYLSRVKFSFARLLLVFILSLSIIATILLLMTQNCKKIWRKYKQSRYKHFQNYTDDGNTIDYLNSSNVRIDKETTPSIAFRTDCDDVQFSSDYYDPEPSLFSKLKAFIRRKRGDRNTDQSDRIPVILESESDRIPDSIYRKFEKRDYKDELFVDNANNVQPNPFIVHLM